MVFHGMVCNFIIIDNGVDLEFDTNSVVALMNGYKDFVKPLYKSPRFVLEKGKVKLTALPLPSKPMNINSAQSSEKVRQFSAEDKISIVSNVYSEINGDVTSSPPCELVSTETQFSRQCSQGQGQMSTTKPNMVFSPCRAQTDNENAKSSSKFLVASSGLRTPKSGGNMTSLTRSSSFGAPLKPRCQVSGTLAGKQLLDSSHSQGSLGAQTVQKSRDNLNNNCNKDVGRHKAHVNRSKSIPTWQPNASSMTSNSKQIRQSDGTQSSSLQHSKSLHVTGVSVGIKEKTSYKPGSRTNSPKSAERNTLKRRKEYDPHKVVGYSKSKANDSKHTCSSDNIFHKNQRVAKSLSFSNSKDVKLRTYKHNSVSSMDDSRPNREVIHVFDDNLRQGFVPYSERSLVSIKVSNSTSNDEIEKAAKSSSAHSSQCYDAQIIASIYQLSLKLKMQTEWTLKKLRDSDVIKNGLNSALDEFENQSTTSEIPAYKSANQELVGILKNLRKLEQHIKIMNKVLFPDNEMSPDPSKDKNEYLQEIERIKNEIAGFQSINTPRKDVWKLEDTASVESDCEELNQADNNLYF